MRTYPFLRVTIKKLGKPFFVFLLIFFLNQSASGSQRILFLDDLGRFVELPQPAVRIVALSDAHAENLVAVRAVKQIAGAAATADQKWIPKSVTRLTLPPPVEEIKALKADLVLMDERWASENSGFVSALSAAELPFAVLREPDLDSFQSYLDRLGRLTGRRRDAENAYSIMEKALRKTEVRSVKTDDPRVLVVAGADYATCPKGGWASHLVAAAGGIPLEKDGLMQTKDSPRFAAYGASHVQAAADGIDVIFTLTNTGRRVKELTREEILRDPRMKNVAAVKTGRVWEVDAATLTRASLVRLDSSLKTCWSLIQKTSD